MSEVESIAEHAEELAKATDKALTDSFVKEIPSIFFIWPVDPGCGLKKLRSEIKKIAVKSMDCFCLCEFQSLVDPSSTSAEAMWHPIANFKTELTQPTELAKKLAPAIRLTRFVLKYGSLISKIAGFPIPDLSDFIKGGTTPGVSALLTTIWGDVLSSKAFQEGKKEAFAKGGANLDIGKTPEPVAFKPDEIEEILKSFPKIRPIVS